MKQDKLIAELKEERKLIIENQKNGKDDSKNWGYEEGRITILTSVINTLDIFGVE